MRNYQSNPNWETSHKSSPTHHKCQGWKTQGKLRNCPRLKGTKEVWPPAVKWKPGSWTRRRTLVGKLAGEACGFVLMLTSWLWSLYLDYSRCWHWRKIGEECSGTLSVLFLQLFYKLKIISKYKILQYPLQRLWIDLLSSLFYFVFFG